MSEPTTTAVEEVARIIDPGAFHDDPIDRHKYCSPRRVEVVQSEAREKALAILALPSVGWSDDWTVDDSLLLRRAMTNCGMAGPVSVETLGVEHVQWARRILRIVAERGCPTPPQPVEDRP